MSLLRLGVPVALLALAVAARTGRAGPVVTLSAEGGVDLSKLHVGQTVTIDATLSGLNPGDSLSVLYSLLSVDPQLIAGTAPVAGPIVPTTGNIFDVVGGPGLPDVTATFIQTSGAAITSNGLFFTFQFTALAPGSGSIQDDGTFSTGTDAAGAPLPQATLAGPLDFAVVPEPSTIAGAGVALFASLTCAWRLRRTEA
jgi:hypothetical protein